MSDKTNIAWTDSTINFWSGCTKVSHGCAHCYAEARDARMMQERVIHWGKGAPRLKHVGAVKQALAMNRKPWICDQCGESTVSDINLCERCGLTGSGRYHRRRIFSLSLGDWLDDEVPIEWLAEMLDTIRQCSDVTWILCTKRPENFFSRMRSTGEYAIKKHKHELMAFITNWVCCKGDFSNIGAGNIILLTSVENQEAADKRIPELLKIPAACRGLSLEPLLGPVDLKFQLTETSGSGDVIRGIDWLIIGGESGHNARPCNVDWIRSLVGQGKAAGVATFVKQLGANQVEIYTPSDEKDLCTVTLNHNDKKGGDPSEWPKDLQVQQWPKGF